MQQHRSRRTAPKTAEDCFGEALRGLRRDKGLTQEDLADKSGYHPTYIGQLERGRKSPSLRTLICISTALDTPASEILQLVEAILRKER